MIDESQAQGTGPDAVGGDPTDLLLFAVIIVSTVKGLVIGRNGSGLDEELPPDCWIVAKHGVAQWMLAVENAWHRTVSGSQEIRTAAGPGLGRVPRERIA